jgi:O-antigen ligase
MNSALFSLAILLPTYRRLSGSAIQNLDGEKGQSVFILIGLLAPILAVFLGQILRGQWNWADFDAPSRLILGAIVYRTLVKTTSPSSTEIGFALSAGLAVTLVLLPLGITTLEGGRFATALSDTNTFGSYVGLMLALFTSLVAFSKFPSEMPYKGLIKLAAVASSFWGAWALFGSQSRGAWIATAGALLLTFWLLMAGNKLKGEKTTSSINPTHLIFTWIGGLIAIVALFPGEGGVLARLGGTASELSAAVQGHYTQASAGIRIQMYRAALDLFCEAPLAGFGDLNYRFARDSSLLAAKYPPEVLQMLTGAGPHSELLGRALQSGVWGVIATVLFFVVPSAIFWCNRKIDSTAIGQMINNSGVTVMFYLSLIQFTTEFSLKHVSSFNAYLLAIMLAISVKSKAAHEKHDKTNI